MGETVRRQIEAADLLVANKTDLVTDPARVIAELSRISPAPVLRTTGGVVDLDVVIGVEPVEEPEHAAGFVPPVHPTATFTWHEPLDRDTFDRALAVTAQPAVLRAKGIFDCVEEPTRPTIVQVVGHRRNVTFGPPWQPDADRRSVLVVIRQPD